MRKPFKAKVHGLAFWLDEVEVAPDVAVPLPVVGGAVPFLQPANKALLLAAAFGRSQEAAIASGKWTENMPIAI